MSEFPGAAEASLLNHPGPGGPVQPGEWGSQTKEIAVTSPLLALPIQRMLLRRPGRVAGPQMQAARAARGDPCTPRQTWCPPPSAWPAAQNGMNFVAGGDSQMDLDFLRPLSTATEATSPCPWTQHTITRTPHKRSRMHWHETHAKSSPAPEPTGPDAEARWGTRSPTQKRPAPRPGPRSAAAARCCRPRHYQPVPRREVATPRPAPGMSSPLLTQRSQHVPHLQVTTRHAA